jgi:iron-sulfur cluster repair protein YtfE (RIC family)
MFTRQCDIHIREGLDAPGLCFLIENECHTAIETSFAGVQRYLSSGAAPDLPLSVTELLEILYSKLTDEVHQLFRKETGLLFPAIRKQAADSSIIRISIPESIHHTHTVITNLLLKIRQLLNNYLIQPNWSKAWKTCVNELFQLEGKIHQWIYIEQNLLYPAVAQTSNKII